ncbi:MAG: hypothetical protein KAT26_11165 [Marinosulfonomonas sp.]|nr:hypothetical protein [Marinosulfonomonas sp.]
MLNMIKNFAADESGAVTVDWVVLTAAVVGLGLAVIAVLREPLSTESNKVGVFLQSYQIEGEFGS